MRHHSDQRLAVVIFGAKFGNAGCNFERALTWMIIDRAAGGCDVLDATKTKLQHDHGIPKSFGFHKFPEIDEGS